MPEQDERGRYICAECGEPIRQGKEVDYGHRVGDTEVTVEAWVCPACDERLYDEAMGHLP